MMIEVEMMMKKNRLRNKEYKLNHKNKIKTPLMRRIQSLKTYFQGLNLVHYTARDLKDRSHKSAPTKTVLSLLCLNDAMFDLNSVILVNITNYSRLINGHIVIRYLTVIQP